MLRSAALAVALLAPSTSFACAMMVPERLLVAENAEQPEQAEEVALGDIFALIDEDPAVVPAPAQAEDDATADAARAAEPVEARVVEPAPQG